VVEKKGRVAGSNPAFYHTVFLMAKVFVFDAFGEDDDGEEHGTCAHDAE